MKKDMHREVEKCVFFIQNVFKYKGFEHAIVGVSGGIDSAVVTALCVKALGSDKIHGFLLPYGTQKDIEHSISVCNEFGVKYEEKNIKSMVDAFPEDVTKDGVYVDTVRRGNVMARVRMIILYDASARYKGLVVGTSNKTELMLGYFTLYGDGACALEPIGHLYKTEVKEMAKILGVPKAVVSKHPSAGLWDGQTDEGELGLTYATMDRILAKFEELGGDLDLNARFQVVTKIAKECSLPIDEVNRALSVIDKNKFKLQNPMMLG